jgi:flavorubredoxin
MKVILTSEQLSLILKNKKIIIDNKTYKFNTKAMTKIRKLIKQRTISGYE